MRRFFLARPRLGAAILLLLFVSPVAAELSGDIRVRTSPVAARIYLDGTPVGTAPLDLSGIAPGRYRLRLEHRGYAPWNEWILVEAGRTTIVATDLERLTGKLHVDADAADVEVYLRDRWVPAQSVELPTGVHSLRFRAFGFEESPREVRIEQGETTTVTVRLQPATLSLPAIEVHPTRFHPESIGGSGVVRATIRVNAPAVMETTVFDEQGLSVISSTHRLDAREAEWSWNGRAPTGAVLPQGDYRVLFTVYDDSTRHLLSRSVTIDRTARVHPGITGSYGRGTTLLPRLEQRERSSFSFQFSGGPLFREEPPLMLELAGEFFPRRKLSVSGHAAVTGDAFSERPRFDLGGNIAYPLLSTIPPLVAGIRLGGHGGTGARFEHERSAAEIGIPVVVERVSSPLGLLVEPGFGFYDFGKGSAAPENPAGFLALGVYGTRPGLFAALSTRIAGDTRIRTARYALDVVIGSPERSLSGRGTLQMAHIGTPWSAEAAQTLLILGIGVAR
jgi:hypothetical protein